MTPTTLKIGSRKSRLALWQARHVADLLGTAHPSLEVVVVTMDTLGDKIRDKPLPQIGAKGLFTQELEAALLHDEIDVAVHSLKDLPTNLPEGLRFAGSPKRANPTDALIARRATSLSELPHDAVIATGSRRRSAQLRAALPHLRFTDLRGNIDTRLQKLDQHEWAGIVMASAALERLDLTEVHAIELDPTRFVPAVSQGALGLETRRGRDDVDALLAPILHQDTVHAVTGERRFLNRLEGGCSVPIGAWCRRIHDEWELDGWVGSLDGQRVLHDRRRGADPVALADQLVDDFLARGAREILADAR